MKKTFLLSFVTILAIAEIFLYSLSPSKVAFVGIARSLPKFRDVYILKLNALCTTPIADFISTGSCSDSLYGIPAGSFDYPLSMFYVARILPQIFFQSANALGTVLGSIFLTLIFAIIIKTRKSWITVFFYSLILLSYPLRYMLERGQTDLIVWILALLPALFLNKLELADNSRHSVNQAKYIFASLMLSLSVAAKAFTAPSLIVWTILLLLRRHFIAGALSVSMLILSLYIVFSSTNPPGSHINSIQNAPGEVFGISVGVLGSSLIQSAMLIIAKLFVFVIVLLLLVFCSGFHQAMKLVLSKRPILFTLEGYSFLISSTSFVALYFFSSSSTYKLASLSLSTLFIFCIIHSLTNSNLLAPTIMSQIHFDCINYALIATSLLFLQYRPYIPGLQFLSQDYAEYLLYPASIAFNVYFVLALLNQARITKNTLVTA